MSINIESIQSLEPQKIWLRIDSEVIDRIQPDPNRYSSSTGLTNAELNRLCLNRFQSWLDEMEIVHTSSFTDEESTSIWDVVTGCAIEVGKTRLILIPSEDLDRDELRIPQEWIDLPNWLGDYYLGLQIDRDAGTMNIWGFASHNSIQQRGEYNHRDRTYSLNGNLLVTNLEIIWLAQELGANERAIVPELPALDLDSALALIKEISIPSAYSPRLKSSFLQWGGLLNNANLRSQLYQTRLQRATIERAPKPSFCLSDWLKAEFTNALASGWQTYRPALGITRNQNTIELAKLINLQLDLQQEPVVLLICLVPENKERMRVLVQVHPGISSRCLPPQLQLSYIDEHGATLRTVTARSNDDCIQLPSFTCPIGMEFNIQLQLHQARVIERFIA
jgi:Protein of unknown function (DUF1822)